MNEPLRVLVVDDEKISRSMTLQHLLNDGYIADMVENAFKALEWLETGQWDVVVSDLRMPAMDGMKLLQKIKQEFPDVDVILITAYGSVENAVTAIHEGAADYLTKPFRFEELAFRLIKLREIRATRKEIETIRALLDNAQSYCGLVGQSPVMKSIYERIQTYADNAVPVLIMGETGTGKELVARALHSQGGRAKGPFIAVACGSIPKELAESELFGHEKGAFTNAIQRRQGSFERAHKGTLLLDDVDDLASEIQAKLLRVLQEGTVVRVGGSEEIELDVRVVATTKENLKNMVADGRFRKDLFYRLRGLEIALPPLKVRGDDVLLLAQYFLNLQANRDRTEPKQLLVESADVLRRYDWPGNVRELRRAMESSVVISQGPEITPQHLPDFLRQRDLQADVPIAPFTLHMDRCDSVPFNELVEQIEDTLIQWALTKAGGRHAQAAEFLHLPRTTFLSKLERHKKALAFNGNVEKST